MEKAEKTPIGANEEKKQRFSFSVINSLEENFSKFEEDLNFKEIELEINSNDMNQSYFLSFYKNKEMEKLNKQITQIISDIIELNTDNIDSVLREVLNKSSRNILKESWGKNNKKLLLNEIHKNYTSLINKIYFFRSNSIPLNENFQARKTFTSSGRKLKKYNSNPYVKRDLVERNSNGDDGENKKLKEDLVEFKKMEFKVISNFFELSESQISGDSVRDWLYENSKY